MNPYQYRVSLRITHPKFDLSRFDSLLGIESQWGWRSGDHKTTVSGVPSPERHADNYWGAELTYSYTESAEASLDAFLRQWLEKLLDHEDLFQQIFDEGGGAQLLVGLYIENATGISIPPDISLMAASLRMSIDFAIYPTDAEEDPMG